MDTSDGSKPQDAQPPRQTHHAHAGDVTWLLQRLSAGDKQAEQLLFEMIFAELKRIASSKLRRERRGHTLQPTALVNEAYLKIMQRGTVEFLNRAHFMALAGQAMRRILADHGRAHKAKKRGAFANAIPIDSSTGLIAASVNPMEMHNLDEALTRLATIDPIAAKVVEMQYFGGLTQEDIAKVLDLSSRTVKRKWALAQAWLKQALAS